MRLSAGIQFGSVRFERCLIMSSGQTNLKNRRCGGVIAVAIAVADLNIRINDKREIEVPSTPTIKSDWTNVYENVSQLKQQT